MKNVLDYGVIADGKTLNTKFLQNLIDKCERNETIFFPKGKYVLSTVFLKSDITILFEEGCLILGSDNFYDYQPDEKVDYPLYQDASHSFFNCSMFVGKDCENINILGKAIIDMRSVWDEDNVRNIVHRGAKCIALKECRNVLIKDITIQNATDLAVYFAGCKKVEIAFVKMRVYIDGISPDNSKDIYIHDCDVESGDDGIVFKSSYTLNRLDVCENAKIENCRIKSRCNAIKFGTETNGGFYNISFNDCYVYDTRIAGIAIESVDGAKIDTINFKNIEMNNVGTPLFIFIGKRLRGPQGLEVGSIQNITLENITAKGPYHPYDIIEWNYDSYKKHDNKQIPQVFGAAATFDGTVYTEDWQITSNVIGLEESKIKNLKLKDVYFELEGGIKKYEREVKGPKIDYPEVYVCGRILPAKGIYFRNVDGLTMDNVKIKTYKEDFREDFIYDNAK